MAKVKEFQKIIIDDQDFKETTAGDYVCECLHLLPFLLPSILAERARIAARQHTLTEGSAHQFHSAVSHEHTPRISAFPHYTMSVLSYQRLCYVSSRGSASRLVWALRMRQADALPHFARQRRN